MLAFVGTVVASASVLPAAIERPPSPIHFTDTSAAARLSFRHVKGGSGRHYYPEQFGGGVALLDYDGDGRLDVYFVQGAPLPGFTQTMPSGDVLYRNNGDGTFTDVSRQAGIGARHYGLGVASADYNNDGFPDLFITTLEGNTLLKNDGHGHFIDVTTAAGVSAPPLSTGAAFVDIDNDGWLDLFVARYTDYTLEHDLRCIDATSVANPVLFAQPRTAPLPPDATLRLDYCGPPAYAETASRLYRNNRNGTFTDVTQQSGVGRSTSHGLGVGIGDFNEDGRPDIFVASDMTPNLLFMNRGDGTFRETALQAGVAVSPSGKPYAGMGVDVADYNHDGHLDLFVTNYENEPSSLYAGTGAGTFEDRSISSGIAGLSQRFLKWGARLVDLDLDGSLDLLMLNGHVDDNLGSGSPPHLPPWPSSGPGAPRLMLPGREGYLQQAQVYRGAPDGRFETASQTAGGYFSEKHAGRGLALGDLDDDGGMDAVIVNNDERAVLLRNDSTQANAWVRIQLRGLGCNRDAIGARVTLRAGALTRTQVVPTAGSYLSEGDRRLLFALPRGDGSATAEIRWPCGAIQTVVVKPLTTTTVEETGCRLVSKPGVRKNQAASR
jgi:hypothetical protein